MNILHRFIVFSTIALFPGCITQRLEVPKEEKPIVSPVGHIKAFSLAEALNARSYYRSVNDTELLLKTLQRIVTLAPDQQTLESVLFELGELLLRLEKYEEAQKVLSEYASYFPGADNIVEARFNEFLSFYRDIRAPHHDQTKTSEALRRGIEFLHEFEGESEHDQTVRDGIIICYEHLFDHELGITEFYLNKFLYTESKSTLAAAEKRIEKIYKELGAHITKPQKQRLASVESLLQEYRKSITSDNAEITIESTTTHA